MRPGTPLACDDDDACSGVETCDPVTGCVAGTPLLCDDADACNGAETCDDAKGCLDGTPLTCDDGDACTLNECTPVAGCLPPTPTDCDDDNPCTDDSCNSNNGCVHQPVPEAFTGTPEPHLEGVSTCGFGTCAAVARLVDGATVCTPRTDNCTPCDASAECLTREYKGRLWRICLTDGATATEAKVACEALGLSLAQASPVESDWLADTASRMTTSPTSPLRFDGDSGDEYSGFVCAATYAWTDYAEHGLYGPSYLGDWSTLGAGHPDLTGGGSLRDDPNVDWAELVVPTTPTNPTLVGSCADGPCTVELQNSFWRNKLDPESPSTVPEESLDRLILRGPKGQATCADYPEASNCYEAVFPALQIRWNGQAPNSGSSMGNEGTVLFTIAHIPHVVIDGMMIEQLGGAHPWQPLRIGYSTFDITDVDTLEIRDSYISGLVHVGHVRVKAVNHTYIHSNEIAGLRVDRLTDSAGTRRSMPLGSLVCSADGKASCPDGQGSCDCPTIGSTGIALSNGNNKHGPGSKTRRPNDCADPTVYVNDFSDRDCDAVVATKTYGCNFCRVDETQCDTDSDCGASGVCAVAVHRCLESPADLTCEYTLYTDTVDGQSVYSEVMAACAEQCDAQFTVLHSNTFQDFSTIETLLSHAPPGAKVSGGVCTPVVTLTGAACGPDDACDAGLECSADNICVGDSCDADGDCAAGFECTWPGQVWKQHIAALGAQNFNLDGQADLLTSELRCCYSYGFLPDAAESEPGVTPPYVLDGFADTKYGETFYWYFVSHAEACPTGLEIPIHYCGARQNDQGERQKVGPATWPNYDQIAAESPGDGILFNNSFRRIFQTDSNFDLGHRRSCDPQYHQKHFRVERNLIDQGTHKAIGMAHPSNGITLTNNLLFRSDGYAYHSFWKQRRLHNSTLWPAQTVPNPWDGEKGANRHVLMKTIEVGDHPEVSSCPNYALDNPSDICTTNEHGFQYLNELIRFDGVGGERGLSTMIWGYRPNTTLYPDFSSYQQTFTSLDYRGLFFGMDTVDFWLFGEKEGGWVDENADHPYRFAAEYCLFDADYGDGSSALAQTLGVDLSDVPTRLPDDVYVASRLFHPAALDEASYDPALHQWLEENPGVPITPANVCESGSVQCLQTYSCAAESPCPTGLTCPSDAMAECEAELCARVTDQCLQQRTDFQSVATVDRDWYGTLRRPDSPTRGAIELPLATCAATSGACPLNAAVQFCD